MSLHSAIKRTSLILLLSIVAFVLFERAAFAEEETMVLDSEAAVLIDAASGDVLYEKNSQQSMYPASITKIITGIIAIEQGELDDIVTISENATEADGTSVYLLEDEQMTLRQLVQGLLINSGNDAATAIAEHMDGSEAAFAERMNQFVEEHVEQPSTTFSNPHGLFAKDHQTNAYEMALLTRYALENDTFRKIVATKEMEWVGEGWETTLFNHHRLLWDYEGTTGVKNGFVSQSGFTLVTSAERKEMELIAVTLKADTAQQSYQDTMELLDYGFKNFTTNLVTSKQSFQDESGNRYSLEEELAFSLKKDKEFTVDVRNGGMLTIKDDNGNLIKEAKLDIIPSKETMQQAHKQSDINEEEAGIIRWFLELLTQFSPL